MGVGVTCHVFHYILLLNHYLSTNHHPALTVEPVRERRTATLDNLIRALEVILSRREGVEVKIERGTI